MENGQFKDSLDEIRERDLKNRERWKMAGNVEGPRPRQTTLAVDYRADPSLIVVGRSVWRG